MKHYIVRQLVSYTAVMSLSAVVIAGTINPSGGISDQDGKGGRWIEVIENSSDSSGEGFGQEPEAQPQDKQYPEFKEWE